MCHAISQDNAHFFLGRLLGDQRWDGREHRLVALDPLPCLAMLIHSLVHSSWSHRHEAIGAAKQFRWCFVYWRGSSWRSFFLWSWWRCDWFATFHWTVFRYGRLCKENHRRRGVGKSLPRIFIHHAWKRVREYSIRYNTRFLKQLPTMHVLSTNLVLLYCICT